MIQKDSVIDSISDTIIPLNIIPVAEVSSPVLCAVDSLNPFSCRNEEGNIGSQVSQMQSLGQDRGFGLIHTEDDSPSPPPLMSVLASRIMNLKGPLQLNKEASSSSQCSNQSRSKGPNSKISQAPSRGAKQRSDK